MKKLVLSIGLLAAIVSCNKTSQNPTYSNGFKWRDISWDVKPTTEYDGKATFLFLREENGKAILYKPFEKMNIGTESIDSVRYIFFKDKMEQIHIYYTSVQQKTGEYLDCVISRLKTDNKSKNPSDANIDKLTREGVFKYFAKADSVVLDSINTHFADCQKMLTYLQYKFGGCSSHSNDGYYWDTSNIRISLDFTEIIFTNKQVEGFEIKNTKKQSDSLYKIQQISRKSSDSLKENKLKNELNDGSL